MKGAVPKRINWKRIRQLVFDVAGVEILAFQATGLTKRKASLLRMRAFVALTRKGVWDRNPGHPPRMGLAKRPVAFRARYDGTTLRVYARAIQSSSSVV